MTKNVFYTFLIRCLETDIHAATLAGRSKTSGEQIPALFLLELEDNGRYETWFAWSRHDFHSSSLYCTVLFFLDALQYD